GAAVSRVRPPLDRRASFGLHAQVFGTKRDLEARFEQARAAGADRRARSGTAPDAVARDHAGAAVAALRRIVAAPARQGRAVEATHPGGGALDLHAAARHAFRTIAPERV